jgi:hypothetical protein
MNTIPQLQNSPEQLRLLCAQRRLYSRAKGVLTLQTLLSVPFAILWALLVLKMPGAKVYAAAWGVAVSLLDLAVFTPRQEVLKRSAASVQELFDCTVLGLNWNVIKAGARPSAEALSSWAKGFGPASAEEEKLRDWYPPAVGELPLWVARIVCQRANCWWDAELRRRYARWSLVIVALVFVLIFIAGVAGHFSVEAWFLGGVAPFAPVVLLGMRQYSEQRKAADRLDGLRGHAERIWNDAAGGADPEKLSLESRSLQDELYAHRSRNPLFFIWIYGLLRNEQEEHMNIAAAELVAEARRHLT